MTGQPMLEGVRIIDMTSVVFGPYTTQILAELGADIIKVESPEGDSFRLSGKPAQTKGMSPGHLNLNKGKRSIILDLKSAEDQAVMNTLIAGADIFIHNVRLEAIERLGFGPESVRANYPGLIYVHCVGFGSGGPYSGLQAYDDVIQAASGAATLAGRVDGTGKARYLPSLIADKVAGLTGAQAVLAAYIHKLRTGNGQFVEVPMFEAFTQFMLLEHLSGLTFDPPNAPECYFRQIDPDRQPFPTADGAISIVPYTVQSWPVVFEVLGDPGFLEQPDLNTPALQFRNQARLYQRTAEITPSKSTAEWVRLFKNARIPCMPVRDMADILEDPHLLETGFFSRDIHPSEGAYFRMRRPVTYSAYPGQELRAAPQLGEHSEEIRREAGQDRQQVARAVSETG
ncbi:carnitine dehydratase [Hyphomonas sp. CACIAM 19H1]|nr:carnitine dehydratase [Hyphomonas sp. CACIAM 19H1]